MKNWIDFDELRKQLVFADVFAYYKVSLTPKGKEGQHVGRCPLPTHQNASGKTFSANFEKGVFQCFGCKASGNVLDFAVLMEGRDKANGKDVREVATMLHERFVEKKALVPPASPKREEPQAKGKVVVNQPLDFELKTLDAAHPYFAKRKLSAETIARFGLGFCKRGLLAGRVAIPLVSEEAELVGYAGLLPDAEEASADVLKYLFPATRTHDDVTYMFQRGRFLYNGFRIGRSVKDLIVVRECHTVWNLWQGGFANVVALMGDDCSAEQATLTTTLTASSARIWLLTDSSMESEECAGAFLPKVASSRLCRWVKVGKEEEIAPEHPLLAVLPKR